MPNRTLLSSFFLLIATFLCGCASSPPQFTKHQLTNQFFSEGANVADFNRDGHMDIVSGPYWYQGPDFTQKHAFMPVTPFNPANAYSNEFFAFTGDFNHDGWPDILIVGFPGINATWFENPQGKDIPWTSHIAVETGVDDESPVLTDLFKNGRPVLVCCHLGRLGYFSPDDANPPGPWKFHAVSPRKDFQRFTHGLGVGDVNGDGRNDIIEHSGWWEQPLSLHGDPLWVYHPADFGPGGAQMFAYDVNGDGRNDIITTIQAHGYGISWFEQTPDGKFIQHPITAGPGQPNPTGVVFSQAHALALIDINGDGLMDIVTGKRHWAHGDHGDPEPNAPAVLYWFQLVRTPGQEPHFIPHLIDSSSGVGTQVVATDVNGDRRPDIVVGNKSGTFVFIQH